MADTCVARVPVFAGLSPDDQHRVEVLARPTHLHSGETACAADDDVSQLMNDATRDSYVRTLSAAYRENRPGWTFLVDFSVHPAQAARVQQMHDAMMAEAVKNGLTWCAFIASNPLVAIQMQRLSTKTGFPVTYVASREEAEAVLAQRSR